MSVSDQRMPLLKFMFIFSSVFLRFYQLAVTIHGMTQSYNFSAIDNICANKLLFMILHWVFLFIFPVQ